MRIFARRCPTCCVAFLCPKRSQVYCGLPCMPLGERGCVGKVRYVSRRRASEARAALRQRVPRELDVYRCNVCGAWHVGRSKT